MSDFLKINPYFLCCRLLIVSYLASVSACKWILLVQLRFWWLKWGGLLPVNLWIPGPGFATRPPPSSCWDLLSWRQRLDGSPWAGPLTYDAFVCCIRKEKWKRPRFGICSGFGNWRCFMVRFHRWWPQENHPLVRLWKTWMGTGRKIVLEKSLSYLVFCWTWGNLTGTKREKSYLSVCLRL